MKLIVEVIMDGKEPRFVKFHGAFDEDEIGFALDACANRPRKVQRSQVYDSYFLPMDVPDGWMKS